MVGGSGLRGGLGVNLNRPIQEQQNGESAWFRLLHFVGCPQRGEPEGGVNATHQVQEEVPATAR